jgi:biotin carboxyl carrier protein
MKYVVTINSNNYEVEVERGQATVMKTDNAAPAAVQQNAAPAATAAAAPVSTNAAEGQKLTAPMPGIILDVKKNAGDRINKGDVVVILEAMKMESEITSPFEGTLVQVATSKGAHVNVGDVLLVIK